MNKDIIDKIARAIYNKYFENLIGELEPAYDDLPPDYKERLTESVKAGLEVLSEPEWWTRK